VGTIAASLLDKEEAETEILILLNVNKYLVPCTNQFRAKTPQVENAVYA